MVVTWKSEISGWSSAAPTRHVTYIQWDKAAAIYRSLFSSTENTIAIPLVYIPACLPASNYIPFLLRQTKPSKRLIVIVCGCVTFFIRSFQMPVYISKLSTCWLQLPHCDPTSLLDSYVSNQYVTFISTATHNINLHKRAVYNRFFILVECTLLITNVWPHCFIRTY